MKDIGAFYGIGVGPGESGMITVAAWRRLQECDLIFAPRSKDSAESVARGCLQGLEIADEKWREVEFTMVRDRTVLSDHYRKLAEDILAELKQGRNVAYLTLGDPQIYSTYSYTLAALKDIEPRLRYRTFPGITSFCALASAVDWPIGEGKERILILPCPDDITDLRSDIEMHDIVVLMKIGKRLGQVVTLLREMGIEEFCAFGKQVGMAGEVLVPRLPLGNCDQALGYFSVMLIRKEARTKRHTTA